MVDRFGAIGRAVLGIDAAWTATEPSGVALAVEDAGGWRLAAVEASYDHFLARARGATPGEARPKGSQPDAGALVGAAVLLCERALDCVAVDMPVGPNPIVRRRPCDDAISRLYGAKKAAVHSPGAARPGPISDALRADFEAFGLPVRIEPPALGVIEVYPHAALIEFMGEGERLPYKAGKTLTYWPSLSVAERQQKLRTVWARIVETLGRRIAGVASALPVPAPTCEAGALRRLKTNSTPSSAPPSPSPR